MPLSVLKLSQRTLIYMLAARNRRSSKAATEGLAAPCEVEEPELTARPDESRVLTAWFCEGREVRGGLHHESPPDEMVCLPAIPRHRPD